MHSSIASLLLVLVTPVAQAGQPSRDPSAGRVATWRHERAASARRYLQRREDDAQLLKPKGGFWMPKFPRQANPPLHDGLPLGALQVDFEAAHELVVTVSLKYGPPHQEPVPVATVPLGTEPVRVNNLERYGVESMVLSVDGFSPAPLVQPTVTSASPCSTSPST